MSEKLDKLRADLARARERRIQLNNRTAAERPHHPEPRRAGGRRGQHERGGTA